MIRYIVLSSLIISSLSLQACAGIGMATGAAAMTGVAAAQEGGISRAVSDTKIKLQINDAWLKYDVEAFGKLSTTVNQGRVLITGVVQNPEHRVEAVRLAWQADGVKQVMNEIRVADSEGITGFVKDSWITSRLRGALTFDRSVQSINYSIDTVQGVVYLMGVGQNQAELNRVIETARTISGVKQVISYVKLAGEPLDGQEKAVPVEQTQISPQPLTYDGTASIPAGTSDPDSYTNVNATSHVGIEEDIDVPARTVSEDEPSIADQYYR